MGQKDAAEKILEDYQDVFADILNVLVFQGKQVVKPEELCETKVLSHYKAKQKMGNFTSRNEMLQSFGRKEVSSSRYVDWKIKRPSIRICLCG